MTGLKDCLPRWRYLLLAGVLGALAIAMPALASSETVPTVEAVNQPGVGPYGEERHSWQPAAVAVMAGGVVTFQSTSATVPHGVVWDGGPQVPSCTGVPIDSGEASWKGTCTFAQAGVYTFHCYVHPTEMTGRVEVSAAGTTTVTTTSPPGTTTGPAGPPPPAAESSPLVGAPGKALTLPGSQRGASIHGALALSAAGTGARLEVDVLASRAALAKAGLGKTPSKARRRTLVGRSIRVVPAAGRLAFAVGLDRRARHALARRRRLVLTVRVLLEPKQGRTLTLTRTVIDRV